MNLSREVNTIIDTDVLVVGGGGAGAFAAIEASKKGLHTIAAVKGRTGRSGATQVAGADMTLDGKSAHQIGLPGDLRDSPEQFFKDIVTEGLFLNNQRMVEGYVENSPIATKHLLDWGLRVRGFEEAHSQIYMRGLIVSGKDLATVLRRKVKESNVGLLEDVMVVDLLTNDDRVVGAVVLDIRSGELVIMKAKAVVLATGGWQMAYPVTSGTFELTGDGQAMAYRARAQLIDMEMVQFIPMTLIWPPIYRGSYLTYIYILVTGLGMLVNNKGERFMEHYDPRMLEHSTKEIISIATELEVRAGRGSPHGGVYFTLRGTSREQFEAGQERLAEEFANGRIEFTKTLPAVAQEAMSGRDFEVHSPAHYMIGGIRVDEKTQTRVRGLFAAGECSGGLWGANRVVSAVSEAVLQGMVAGRHASRYAAKARPPELDEAQLREVVERILRPLRQERGTKPIELRREVQEIAQNYIGIIRDEEGLRRGLSELNAIKQDLQRLCVSATSSRKCNAEWLEAIQILNMIQCLETSGRSSLTRAESRGALYRSDCPNTDNDQWLRSVIAEEEDGEVKITTEPIVITTLEPPRGVMTYQESIGVATASLERK